MIELMVSIVLGLLLTSGIVAVYLESKRHYLIEDEMARMQENGRFALHLLKRELTLAGFYAGDLTIRAMTPPGVAPDCGSALDWSLDPNPPLELINDFSGSAVTAQGSTLDCLDTDDILEATDVVSVKRSAGEPTLRNGVYRAGTVAADQNQWYLRVADYGDDVTWEYIGEADFDGADATAGSRVDYWEVYANIFFIREYSESGDGIPTLCTERLSADSMGPVECIVEGIEDLQVEFGIDADADGVPNQYKADPTAADMPAAVVARVYLLVRSLNEISGYTNSKSFQLGQKTVAPKNDGYLRRVLTTAVQMRNATLPPG
ncbi:PilW family protein [Parahaliea mediterranea]|uniref:PilW family protein n=1 Tax=Parahaliea mediterranea TaxID=651086 RepID=A0A939DBZ1_9GAMM|nr:PilW family protein [Parahaliea mediterranea]MBN7795219.1 PilW family protein [Parahaliea mediterranea]